MHRPSGKLMRVLAVAAAAAMLVSAMPAVVATAAPGELACKVHNLDQNTNRNTLQRAVWDADPGDALLVQGTCRGTTLIRKDLDISYMGWAGAPMPLGKKYVSKPRGKIVSGSWRPALVIHPRVNELTINRGLRVIGGIVIGDVKAWQGAKAAPSAWKQAARSELSTAGTSGLRRCHVTDRGSGAEFPRSQMAVRAASPGGRLLLRGACGGETYIDKDLSIVGYRIDISAARFDAKGKTKVIAKDSSGPPALTRVIVDDDVDSLVLKRVRVTNGFEIRDFAP